MNAPQLAAEKSGKEEFVDELKPGTRLLQGQYTISRFINSGGFGITYLAKDSLDRNVVIKECFPGSFCRRSDTIVGARSRAHQAEFKSIVKLFVQEARSLAKLVHPHIVGVHQVFEDNDTAYMAIDFIDGRDLLDLIEDPAIELTPERVVSMTHKLLNAVGFIHDNGILHRDISPDNILINQKGDPILIDFGAAREEATRASRALSALRVVKDGYSPQEFYIAGSEQGPWSDLYALAATLYHAITGHPPTNSQVRLAAIADEGGVDPYVPLAGHFVGYPIGFLEAIDKAMHAVPRRRIQSAGDWLAMLANPPADVRAADPAVAVSRLITESMVTLSEPESEPQAEEPAPAASEAPAETALLAPEGDLDAADDTEADTAPDPEPEAMDETPEAVAAAVHPTRISTKYEPLPTPAKGGSGRGLLIGVSVVAALAVLGYVMMPGGEKPTMQEAAETTAVASATATGTGAAASDSASVEPTLPADPGAATDTQTAATEPATAPATGATAAPAAEAETQAAAEPEPAAEPEAQAEAEAEVVAAAEPAAEPAPVAVDANQIAYALWDVRVPYTTEVRTVGGVSYGTIKTVDPNADLTVAGEWIVPGATVYSVNGNPISSRLDSGALILRNLSVENDGMARSAVRIKAPGQNQYQRVELAVPVVRRIGLVNGLTAEAHFVDGTWQVTVTGEPASGTTLRVGDVLVSETTTGVNVTRPESLEDIVARLVERQTATASFKIFRDGVADSASLTLTTKK